ncbi:MAG: peptidoglycan editing factor PgeF [Candidatus Solibacter usitatus]|nr:peptidoglycan editing factor PgeF [Candidatus Solibacter usitatus]
MSIVKASPDSFASTLLSQFDWLHHAFLTSAAQAPPGVLLLHQIHSSTVLEAPACTPASEGDALVTRQAGVQLGVKTADCLPILIADPVTRCAAAVHAGWRGTLSNIAAAAVSRLYSLYGALPAHLHAAFGPSIGPCCFEVGPDVAPLFHPLFPERSDLHQQTRIDLRQANLRQLLAAGLQTAHIDPLPPCTFCGGPDFHSWRRDRNPAARMFSVIALR